MTLSHLGHCAQHSSLCPPCRAACVRPGCASLAATLRVHMAASRVCGPLGSPARQGTSCPLPRRTDASYLQQVASRRPTGRVSEAVAVSAEVLPPHPPQQLRCRPNPARCATKSMAGRARSPHYVPVPHGCSFGRAREAGVPAQLGVAAALQQKTLLASPATGHTCLETPQQRPCSAPPRGGHLCRGQGRVTAPPLRMLSGYCHAFGAVRVGMGVEWAHGGPAGAEP